MKNIIESIFCKIHNVNYLIPNLNEGGCGFFALEAYNLFKSFGFKPKLIALYISPYRIDDYYFMTHNIDEAIKNNKRPSCYSTPHHVCIKVGRYYIDSCGYSTKLKDNSVSLGYYKWIVGGEIALEHLTHLLKYPSVWNPTYKRTNNKVLKKIMKQIQKDLVVNNGN